MMLKLGSRLFLIGTALLLANCSDKKLTPEQKQSVIELSRSTNTIYRSASRVQRPDSSPRFGLAIEPSELESTLTDRISKGNCTFSSGGENVSSVSAGSMSMKISGEGCPISMDLQFGMVASQINIRVFFELTDPELAEISDVTKSDINGKINVSSSSANGQISGFILSKKFGKVNVTANIEANKNSAKAELRYEFPARFTAVLKLEQERGRTAKYELNGESISAEEFARMNCTAGTVGQTDIGLGNSPSTQPSPAPIPTNPEDLQNPPPIPTHPGDFQHDTFPTPTRMPTTLAQPSGEISGG